MMFHSTGNVVEPRYKTITLLFVYADKRQMKAFPIVCKGSDLRTAADTSISMPIYCPRPSFPSMFPLWSLYLPAFPLLSLCSAGSPASRHCTSSPELGDLALLKPSHYNGKGAAAEGITL